MNPASNLQRGFCVGGWAVAPMLNRISRHEATVQLEPRVMRLLLCLAARPGEVVTHDEIADRVWGDAIVGTDSISRAVFDLRRAFDDDPQRPAFIVTIRSVGYQLIAPVTDLPAPARSLHTGTAAAGPPAPRRTGFGPVPKGILTAGVVLLCAGALFSLGRSASSTPVPLQPTPLTTSLGIEFDPALSPDGRRLAFVWSGPDGDNLDIYVKHVDSSRAERVTDHPPPGFDGSPSWSADGRALAFMRSTDDTCGIIIRGLDSGEERKVAGCHYHNESSVAWSPDGEWIVFADLPNPNGPHTLFLASTSTLDVRQLTYPPAGYYGDLDPAFSPDGRSVAFVRGNLEGNLAHLVSPSIGDLHLVDVASGEVRRLTHDYREIPGLGWAPDGRSIIFSSNRGNGTYSLWRADLDGASVRPVLVTRGMIKNPSFALNAPRMVYEDWQGDTDIWRLKLDEVPPEPRILASSTREESMPQFSPDGTRIVFVSNRSGAPELWTADASGQRPVQLTHFGGAHMGSPRWSPDGAWISYVSYQDGNADVFLLPSGGGTPQNLTAHPAYDLVPTWSRDGQWVYFGSNRDGSWQVWKLKPSGAGAAERVTRDGGFAAQEARHDGEDVLFFTRVDDHGLWRKVLRSGEEEQTPLPLFKKDWGNWVAGTRGIYFVHREWGVAWHVAFYDYEAQTVTDLATLQGHWAWTLPGMSLSPDEAWLLFTQSDLTNSDIMLVDGYD